MKRRKEGERKEEKRERGEGMEKWVDWKRNDGLFQPSIEMTSWRIVRPSSVKFSAYTLPTLPRS